MEKKSNPCVLYVQEMECYRRKNNREEVSKKVDNFLSTLVFLLPGVLAYFWLQAFGVNPVAKHSPTEFTAVAALFWLPVSFITLVLYNLIVKISHYVSEANEIWTIQDLRNASVSFTFLIAFLLLSIMVSFLVSFIWASWGFKLQQGIINWVRVRRGVAKFSDTTSVWDEVFGKHESQVVEIGRLDKPENITMIGTIHKASRTFEAERLCLDDVNFMTELIREYNIPIEKVFVDTKAGLYIKVFDLNTIQQFVPIKEEKLKASSEAEEA